MAVDSISSVVSQITGAIRQAAQSTGISFEYLLTTARIESNLNPAAQASTSSAKGLYQFIDQTWLGTMKQAGPALGYGQYADAISQGADGRYEVADPNTRTAIMKLRNDPQASALLAGAFSQANAAQVSSAIGRQPTEGELYIAHFLGPDGAGRMINAAANRPDASAAALFPAAAAANRSIFYDRAGNAKSVKDVYAKLTGRFEVARAASFAPGLRSTLPAAPSPVSSPVLSAVSSPVSSQIPNPVTAKAKTEAKTKTPDTAGITQAYAAASAQLPPVADTKPLFQAMFTDRGGSAVAPLVNSLWGGGKTAAGPSGSAPARGLDLFSDGKTDIRGLFGQS